MTAVVSSALEWPSAQVEMPATKSRYSLPVSSVSLHPLPDTIVSG